MIEIRNLSKSYGVKEILKNINLSINRGEITFIVGTSGTGKTTLLNLIGGLDNVTSGTILLDKENIKNNLNEYRAKKVGFIFQDFNLVSGLTVEKNIQLAMELFGENYSKDGIVTELNSLGIKDINQKAETLSGGEKQRVAIIRSICKNSDVIIADEPTGNLDSENADLVLGMLSKMKKDKHIIIVSHDIEKAIKYGDRIITLKDGEIISDETQEKEQSNIPDKLNNNIQDKSKNKNSLLKSVVMLGKNSVRIRKGKIFSIALILALAISSVAMVINFNMSGGKLSHDLNVNYLENDLINLYFESTPNTGFKEMTFSEDEITEIQKTSELKDYVPIYQMESSSWLFNVSNKTTQSYLKQIKIDDFFKERVMANEIEGRFLANENEIILAGDVASALFDGECIGKTISLNDGMGEKTNFLIVGINRTVNPFDKIYSYVSNLKIKELLSQKMKATIYKRLEVLEFYTKIQGVSSGGLYGAMKEYNGDDKILYGVKPNVATNIMISSELATHAFETFGIKNNVTTTDIISGKLSNLLFRELSNKKLVINFNGLFPVNICGIYESKEISMRFNNDLITKLQKIDPIGMDIYIKNPTNITSVKESITNNKQFIASTQLENLKSSISGQSRFFSLALIIIGVILFLISIVLLSSFSKIAVLERKKEVAIIKSLGANNRNVLLVLLFDSAVIAMLSLALSLMSYAILNAILPYIMPQSTIQYYGYPLSLLIVINIIFTLLVIVYTGLNLRRLVKKMPAELLSE